jgi:hypothetical protein
MRTQTKSRLLTTLLTAALFTGAGFAYGHPLPVLPTVGPDSGSKPAVPGYLVVYTDTESPINTGDIQYYPHTSYKIYDSNGSLYRSVRNHLSERDEKPARVNLPPGRYTVVGKSETRGEVVVPVIVGALRTTVVNLEKRGHDTPNS